MKDELVIGLIIISVLCGLLIITVSLHGDTTSVMSNATIIDQKSIESLLLIGKVFVPYTYYENTIAIENNSSSIFTITDRDLYEFHHIGDTIEVLTFYSNKTNKLIRVDWNPDR